MTKFTSKFVLTFLVVLTINILIGYFFIVRKDMSLENLSFYLLCANLFIAFLTKEDKSFARIKGYDTKVNVATLNPLENDTPNLNNKEEVENILTNFQKDKNHTGLAFGVMGAIFLLYSIIIALF